MPALALECARDQSLCVSDLIIVGAVGIRSIDEHDTEFIDGPLQQLYGQLLGRTLLGLDCEAHRTVTNLIHRQAASAELSLLHCRHTEVCIGAMRKCVEVFAPVKAQGGSIAR